MSKKGVLRERQAGHKRPKRARDKRNERGESPPLVLKPIAVDPRLHSPEFGEWFVRRWRRWTLTEKVAYTSLMLLAAGGTIYAMYHLVPIIVSQMDEAADHRATTVPVKTRPVLPRPSMCLLSDELKVQRTFMQEFKVGIHPGVPKKFMLQVRNAAIKVAESNRVSASVMRQKDFSVEIVRVPAGAAEHSYPIASYDDRANAVKFWYHPDTEFKQESDIVEVMENEMHHAGIRVSNYKKHRRKSFKLGKARGHDKKLLRGQPFLDEHGNADPALIRHLHDAVLSAKKSVSSVKKIFMARDGGQPLSSEQEAIIAEFLQEVKAYTPNTETITIRRGFIEKALWSGDYIKSTLPGVLYEVVDLKRVIGLPISVPSRMYITSRKEVRDGVKITFTFAKDGRPSERARGFLTDWAMNLNTMKMDPTYRSLQPAERDAELLSFLDEWPPGLKALLAPEVCEYLSDYHSVQDYCEPCWP